MIPVGTVIVKSEKMENINEPKNTIHFLTILSAKYPKINIVIPVKIIKEKVSTPIGAVSPPNPK